MTRIGWIAGSLGCLLIGPMLRADTLYISSTGGNPVVYSNVTIVRVAGGSVVYTTSPDGPPINMPVANVERMQIDGETALNAAETALAAKKWDDAVDAYNRVVQSTDKPWLKDWASMRLLAAGQKSSRFDATATAYIAMLLKDPAAAEKIKPQMPAAGSTYLDSALSQANIALGNRDLSDRQKLALLGFVLDLQKAKNNQAGVDEASRQIDGILAKDPNNPAAGQALARRNIVSAQQALDRKDFAKAISEIQSNRANFVDPIQQADALFIVAQAQEGLASVTKGQTAIKDAGLAYMRVVADFKDTPNKPHVAMSLLRTGMIEEQLNEPQAAAKLYQQVIQEYPNDPAAGIAKQKMQSK
ncbi:MAG TPA: tetratricopeptide repeat protein [Tepidisphaeraceae bacterium]|jgi:TolA-binding protein|nr:tetratricopeptide repeat protein [Tepidisphaeraceae bacterium]